MPAIMRKRASGEVDFFGHADNDEVIQRIANHTKPYVGFAVVKERLLAKERVSTKYSTFFLAEPNR